MKRLYYTILPILLLCQNSLGEDEGVWQTTKFEIPIETYTLKFQNENRFDGGFDDFLRTHVEGSFEIPLPFEGLSIEPAYRYIIHDGNDNPTSEYNLNLNYKLKKIFGTEWSLKFRNRFETIYNHEKDDASYQNRFKIELSHPLPVKGYDDESWEFWIYEEPFYQFDYDDWGENRCGTGFTIPIYKNTELDLGGQWRSQKGSNGWNDSYQALIEVKYKF